MEDARKFKLVKGVYAYPVSSERLPQPVRTGTGAVVPKSVTTKLGRIWRGFL